MPISRSMPRLHGYIAADLNNQPGNRIVEHGSQIIVQLRYFASRRTKRGILQRRWYRGMVSKSFADASVISPGRLGWTGRDKHPQANKARQPGQFTGSKSWIGMWKP